jgi:hypothetical protein
MTLPVHPSPYAIANDARFLNTPAEFYAELREVLAKRMGDPDVAAEEASKIWAEAQRVPLERAA